MAAAGRALRDGRGAGREREAGAQVRGATTGSTSATRFGTATSATAVALLDDEHFDLVLGSPPVFSARHGHRGDHPQKIACRFELRGDVGDYARRRGASRRRGLFACVFPEEQRAVEAARGSRARVVRRRAVVFREGEPPLFALFPLMQSPICRSDARATWVEPPLTIRTADGGSTPIRGGETRGWVSALETSAAHDCATLAPSNQLHTSIEP